MNVARAAGVYVLITFAAGFVWGTLRTVVSAPAWGALPAVALEIPVMFAVAWWASARALRWAPIPAGAGPALAMGAVFFGLLQGAELALRFAVSGGVMETVLAAYAAPEALIGIAAQALTALFPLGHVLRNRP